MAYTLGILTGIKKPSFQWQPYVIQEKVIPMRSKLIYCFSFLGKPKKLAEAPRRKLHLVSKQK